MPARKQVTVTVTAEPKLTGYVVNVVLRGSPALVARQRVEIRYGSRSLSVLTDWKGRVSVPTSLRRGSVRVTVPGSAVLAPASATLRLRDLGAQHAY